MIEETLPKRGVVVAAVAGLKETRKTPGVWVWYVSKECWQAGITPDGDENHPEIASYVELLESVPPDRTIVVLTESETMYNDIVNGIALLKASNWEKRKGMSKDYIFLLRELDYLLSTRAGNVDMRWASRESDIKLMKDATEAAHRVLTIPEKDIRRRGTHPVTGPGWNPHGVVETESSRIGEVKAVSLRELF